MNERKKEQKHKPRTQNTVFISVLDRHEHRACFLILRSLSFKDSGLQWVRSGPVPDLFRPQTVSGHRLATLARLALALIRIAKHPAAYFGDVFCSFAAEPGIDFAFSRRREARSVWAGGRDQVLQ